MELLKLLLKTVITISGFIVLADVYCREIADDFYVLQDLGDNYILDTDFCLLYRHDGNQYFIIPNGVRDVSFDDKWIIVETRVKKASHNGYATDSTYQYWLVDKESPLHFDYPMPDSISMGGYSYPIPSTGIDGPMDSISFVQFLKFRDIDLRFTGHRFVEY